MNKFDLKKKVAIVTGGAQGFGLDITKRFLTSGAKVIIWDNDENELKKIFKKIKNKNLYNLMVDVTDPEKVEDAVRKITKNSSKMEAKMVPKSMRNCIHRHPKKSSKK